MSGSSPAKSGASQDSLDAAFADWGEEGWEKEEQEQGDEEALDEQQQQGDEEGEGQGRDEDEEQGATDYEDDQEGGGAGAGGRRGDGEDDDDEDDDESIDLDALAEDLEKEDPILAGRRAKGRRLEAEGDGEDEGGAAGGGSKPPAAKRQRRIVVAKRRGRAGSEEGDGEGGARGPVAKAGAAQAAPLPVLQAEGLFAADGGGGSSNLTPEQQACPHPSFWCKMCVVCGYTKPSEEDGEEGGGFGMAAAAAAAAGVRGAQRQASGAAAGTSTRGPHSRAGPSSARAPGAGLGGGGSAGGAGGSTGGGGGSTSIRHLHARGELEVSAAEAARVVAAESARLRAAKKLVLVLDLDHTLLNSVRITDVTPEHTTLLEQVVEAEDKRMHRTLYCLRDKNLWTKLRPGVHALLATLQPLYELHIYTMGDKQYAAEVRRLLDPQRRLFASVISQNDSTSTAAKDLDVALADDALVVIMDDTEQVWPRHRRNLVQVDRYHFFPASLAQWGVAKGNRSLLEAGRDESEERGTLATCVRVLRDVHAQFFGAGAELPVEQRDVRFFLGRRREEVLHGCVLAFSHCWPTALPNPYDHPLWKLAESLGADCRTAYDPEHVTHMVAGAPGTAKAVQAASEGKFVVSPEWLTASMFRWQKAEEAGFPPVQPGPGGRRGGGAPLHLSPTDELQMALKSAGGGAS